ncbi:AAA family ATPase [Vibrio parahaemolyticus]|nr:AAA family ATPase [Vibrio parahaemolyticus]ELB2188995.1 AAA family ATPase [Vibrio parahaemolyticus]ELB2194380.1 AAA family ATPase [Vibrio parahaemolyticus]ELB2214495.1 AAA family ATPase [Vibrio parahaemolyticus]ELB2233936.1 AAA family ATPase [Vibrio parahaemolyticus]
MNKNNESYRLLYVWVDSYKNINRKGLLLSLDYCIENNNDVVSAKETNFFRLKNNPLKELDLFSAIVGKNGAGKTHFLNIISNILCTGRFSSEVNNSYAIFEKITIDGDKKLCMLKSEQNKYNFISGDVIEEIPIESVEVIEYNPLHNKEEFKKNFPNCKRISSEYVTKSIDQVEVFDSAKKLSSSKDALIFESLNSVRNNSHASFVLRYNDLKKEVKTKKINLTKGSRLQEEWMIPFKKYFFDTINNSHCNIEMINLCFVYLYWIELLKNYEREISENYKCSLEEVSLAYMMIALYDPNEGHKLSDSVKSAVNYFGKSDSPNASSLFPRPSFKSLDKAREIWSLEEYLYTDGEFEACLSIPFKKSDELSKLLYDISDISSDKDKYDSRRFLFNRYHLAGLSSGEKQIIHFTGQLRNLLTENNGKRVFILIDEVEVAFHPEWQRNLIDILSSLFHSVSELVDDFKNPQIIMVTHSPFILSDILNGKALSLDGSNNSCFNTFGANIHDLLSRSFFMERNIGESVSKIIMDCAKSIDELSGNVEGFNNERIYNLQFVIENIADPLIKNHLLSKLHTVNKGKSILQNKLKELVDSNFTDEEIMVKIERMARRD